MKVQVVATPILEVAGVKAYHTSIVIGRTEYFFDADGIITAPALWSHTGIDGKAPSKSEEPAGTALTEVIDVGVTPVSPEAFMRSMSPFFLAGTYDIILKNCNTFSDAALYFLTRTRIQSRFSRLERLIATARPFSTRLLSAALQAIQQDQQQSPAGYTMNPLAEHFNIEDVIMACDSADIARWGRAAGRKNKGSLFCNSNNAWNISGCCQACEVLATETTSTCVEPNKDFAVGDAVEGSLDSDNVARAAELLPVHKMEAGAWGTTGVTAFSPTSERRHVRI